MSAKIECQVCFDNVKVDQCLSCCFCEKELCKKCIVSWMNTKKALTCPLCNKLFPRYFIVGKFGKAFMHKFAIIEKETLLVREKLMIPEYSKYLYIPEAMEKHKLKINELEAILRKYRLMDPKLFKNDKDLMDLIGEKVNKTIVCKFYLDQVIAEKYQLQILRRILTDQQLREQDGPSTSTSVKPVCPCPINECKGYVRKSDYKCCICEKEICKKCFVNIDNEEEHTCKKEDIESVENINKESKPCPNCGSRISKTDGCDQMFCIMCDTAFSWNTGKVEKGRIHNPEYYRKLREKNINIPREEGDCNINIRDGIFRLSNHIRSLPSNMTSVMSMVQTIHNIIHMKLSEYLHVIDHNRAALDRLDQIRTDKTLISKIEYLQNKITEKEFMDIIYKRHLTTVLNNELREEVNDCTNTMEYLINKANEYVVQYIQDLTNNPNKYGLYDHLRHCYDKYIKEIFKLIDTGYEFLGISEKNVNRIKSSYYNYTNKHISEYLFDFYTEDQRIELNHVEKKETTILRMIDLIREKTKII